MDKQLSYFVVGLGVLAFVFQLLAFSTTGWFVVSFGGKYSNISSREFTQKQFLLENINFPTKIEDDGKINSGIHMPVLPSPGLKDENSKGSSEKKEGSDLDNNGSISLPKGSIDGTDTPISGESDDTTPKMPIDDGRVLVTSDKDDTTTPRIPIDIGGVPTSDKNNDTSSKPNEMNDIPSRSLRWRRTVNESGNEHFFTRPRPKLPDKSGNIIVPRPVIRPLRTSVGPDGNVESNSNSTSPRPLLLERPTVKIEPRNMAHKSGESNDTEVSESQPANLTFPDSSLESTDDSSDTGRPVLTTKPTRSGKFTFLNKPNNRTNITPRASIGTGKYAFPNKPNNRLTSTAIPTKWSGKFTFSNKPNNRLTSTARPTKGSGKFTFPNKPNNRLTSTARPTKGSGKFTFPNKPNNRLTSTARPTKGSGKFTFPNKPNNRLTLTARPTKGSGKFTLPNKPNNRQTSTQKPTGGNGKFTFPNKPDNRSVLTTMSSEGGGKFTFPNKPNTRTDPTV